MSLLRLAVLGPPEVFRDGSRLTFALRKAQALLLYLAVEGSMHPRSKLAAFLWPDSGPEEGRTALRSALVPLRRLLVDPDASASQHSHLQSSRDLLGLNPQAPLELDLDVVQQAYQQARLHSTPTSREQYAALVTQCQRAVALVRGARSSSASGRRASSRRRLRYPAPAHPPGGRAPPRPPPPSGPAPLPRPQQT